jgi:serine protease Do
VNGTVIGLADAVDTQAEGIGYAVPATAAAPLFAQWRATPAPPVTPTCSNPLGPSTSGSIQSGTSAPNAEGILNTLNTYFNAIDSGDYATAYAQLSPAEQETFTEAKFAADDATSYDYNITLEALSSQADGSDLADVSFTSLQSAADGPNGDQCDNWTLEYTMVSSGGTWLIESGSGQGGVTHLSC